MNIAEPADPARSLTGLPDGWTARTPELGDLQVLADLRGADKEPWTGSRKADREGVEIRRVRRDNGVGMPEESDLRAVHDVLEASFADHFNSYRETFEEFVSRLREDPGHQWDHWWLATVDGSALHAASATPTSAAS